MPASQYSSNANLKTLLKFKNLRGKLKKDFAFKTEPYSKILVWKNLKFIWHFFQTWCFLFLSGYNGNMTPEGLLFSPHSHKLLAVLTFIRFCRHFYIKKYEKLFHISEILFQLCYVFPRILTQFCTGFFLMHCSL